ncbi:MAG TPA: hypothetical protein VGB44_08255 [Flavobacterium sp.]|jgi:hypothetical protein
MRYFFLIILFLSFNAIHAQQHCGYDFTSYVVLHVHEEGKKENIPGLRITLVDASGNDVVNMSNKYSWKHKDEVLYFSENYRIDSAGNAVSAEVAEADLRWFFPFAKDTYYLSVTNDFPADDMRVKIVDDKGIYAEATFPLYAFNMYILCSTQAQQQAMQFGRRSNKPVDIVLSKK